jgi:hypothetical protein
MYKRHGVRYAKPQYNFKRKELNRSAIQAQQQTISRDLTSMLIANKHIVYVDETTFHQWQMPSRAWVRRDMDLQMPSTRGGSVTVIGAISERMGLVHYSIFAGSNDQNRFADFLEGLIAKLDGWAVIAMDNYSVHRSSRAQQMFNERVQ